MYIVIREDKFNILCFLVPLWSGVNVAGVQFRDIIPNIGLKTDDEKWGEIAKDVVKL